MIGLISATAAGTVARDRLAAVWPDRTRVYEGPAREAVPRAFGECEQLVCFLATGAVVRLVAPLLTAKADDPGIVCVDEGQQHAVALLGGHGGGANALARAVADALPGCRPVVTTATDATGIPGLDTLGWPVEGAVPAVTRAILDGAPVVFHSDAQWPLPALPPNVRPKPRHLTPGAAVHSPGMPGSGAAGDPAPPSFATGPAAVAASDASTACDAAPPSRAATGTTEPPAKGMTANPNSAGPESAGPESGRPAVVPSEAHGRTATTDGPFAFTATADTARTAGGSPGSTTAPADGADQCHSRPDTPQGADSSAASAEQTPTARDGYRAPATPAGTADTGAAVLWVSDRTTVRIGEQGAVLRPPSLVVGVGASRGVAVDEVLGLIREALAAGGLSPCCVTELATVDAKAGEAGLVGAADRLDVPLRTYPADALAAVDVPNPSPSPLAAVGTPSVAEAAALLTAGPGAELLVPKQKSAPEGRAAMATAAVARRRPRGRLAVVGLGPGARDLLTPRACEELRRASTVVGLDQYVDQIRDLLRPGTRILESGLGAEEERARTAVAEARAGRAVALIGSGDAGVYAMASPALAEASDDIDVVGVPGVTAALAAAALLGAPLGHDHVSISLSDLHTPWEVIEGRVRAAAEADLVVTFYNPRSRGRDWQLPKALGILAEHRAPMTPAGVVRNASRADESARLTTVAELDPSTVDMMTVVVVGNTATRVVAGRMVTPRGYRWQS